MNADPIEEICATLTHLRQNPATKKRFPSETWDAIIFRNRSRSSIREKKGKHGHKPASGYTARDCIL